MRIVATALTSMCGFLLTGATALADPVSLSCIPDGMGIAGHESPQSIIYLKVSFDDYKVDLVGSGLLGGYYNHKYSNEGRDADGKPTFVVINDINVIFGTGVYDKGGIGWVLNRETGQLDYPYGPFHCEIRQKKF